MIEKEDLEEFEEEEETIAEPNSEEELEQAESTLEEENEQDYSDCEVNTTVHDINTSEMSDLGLYMHRIGMYKNLSTEEEQKLGEAASAGNKRARDKLVNHNLRLVISIAKKYTGHGVGIDDLISYGNIGLMEAVSKFDFTKGFRFTTYATYWIRMEIRRGINKIKHIISKPEYVLSTMSIVGKTQKELQEILRRDPTSEEISEALNGVLTSRQVDNIKSIVLHEKPVSLNNKIDNNDSDSETFEDYLISDATTETPEECLMKEEKGRILNEAVKELKPQFQTIIKLRYGIGEGVPEGAKIYTLDEIAEVLWSEGYGNKKGEQYTKEYVRQMENNALEALKKNPKVKALGGI